MRSALSAGRNIRLILMYDGTNYFGFAGQMGVPTVSGELARALKELFDDDLPVIGASRTDRGVHAIGQVVNFKCGPKIRTDEIGRALNFYLPEDIRVLSADETDQAFHARFSAKGKEYRYRVFEGAQVPFDRRFYALHLKRAIDLAAIKEARRYLLGEHDFTSFAQELTGSAIRRIDSIEIEESAHSLGRFLDFHFRGSGFLYKMIRTIMGTLIDVGLGKKRAGEVEEILKARDRKRAGMTVLPHGLCLMKVEY